MFPPKTTPKLNNKGREGKKIYEALKSQTLKESHKAKNYRRLKTQESFYLA